ncbi:MAG: methyltransferase [Clostridia bacterium]|nr:methyltransferase [Clostridia bacterium]
MIEQRKNSSVPLAEHERLDTVNEQIRLIQKEKGFTFGTDAYLLAAYVRPQPHEHAVDLGSGTGIIPLLLLARNKIQSVTAVEIQPAFSELISRNAVINGMEGRIHPLCADVRTLRPSDIGGEVALVVSNPPYMKCTTGKRNEHDEKYIARHEVCGTVSDFCSCAGRLLKHGGRFVCVFRPDRLTELLEAMRNARLEPKRMTFVHADESSEPSSVLVEAIKGAVPSLRISPPLLLHEHADSKEKTRRLTPAAQKIYETCAFFE